MGFKPWKYCLWTSKCPTFVQWESLQETTWLQWSLIPSLLSAVKRQLGLIFSISWPRSRIKHFSKKSYFLLARNGYFKTLTWALIWWLFLNSILCIGRRTDSFFQTMGYSVKKYFVSFLDNISPEIGHVWTNSVVETI